MYVYNSTDHNQTGAFLRLINALRQAKSHNRGFTIFLGAGCSLSSSPNDISTSKIIENCIRDNYKPDYKNPGSWEELYRDFINNVWEHHGKIERQEILEKYFLNLRPSKGYLYLRNLVEQGYITNIVTTNFDMLLNRSLDGIAYTIHVGNLPPRRINGGSLITLHKIHGDIESGELIFSPEDIRNLPQKICEDIKEISKKSCLFCGYSGQDQGLMKNLDTNSDYVVYWATPQKPLKDDIYGTKYIYDWISARGSESNFIYGNELGKFDDLMKNLVKALIENENELIFTNQWEKNTISETIQINHRVFSIFQQLLNCSSSLRNEYEWKKQFPFYSKDYETTLNAYLYYYCESASLPPTLLQIPENEIEALIMGLAIEVLASISGIDLSVENYINKLKTNYERSNPNYFPDNTFWIALTAVLVSIENNIPLQDNKDLLDIKLQMNSSGRMTLSVKEPKLHYVADVISLLSISSLFIPTCENESSIDRYGETKILLQKHGQTVCVTDDKLCFKLNKVSKFELKEIFDVFFHNLNDYHLDDNGMIIGPKVRIIADLSDKSGNKSVASIPEYIYSLETKSKNAFLKLKSAFELDRENYVFSPLDASIDEFVISDKLGMFIIGSSGSGKTKAFQNFIRSDLNSELIKLIASPRMSSFENTLGLSVFWNNLGIFNDEKILLEEINAMLSTRGKKLLLIIDGLNEIDGGMEICILHYKSITETIDKLSMLGIKTIKILVACRDHTFLDYCESTNLYPSSELCYCSIAKDHITPYYQIQPLTFEQQLQFVNVYFDDPIKKKAFELDLKTNRNISKIFNQPYLIAVAGKYYAAKENETVISTQQEIFKFYTEQMLKRLGNHSSINTARKIINAYFDLLIHSNRFGRRITPFTLLARITKEDDNELFVEILNQLCDINVFTNTAHSEEYIRFTHDRIEEYFLCDYLYASANNTEVLKKAFEIAGTDPVFYSAAMEYFRKLARQGHFEQIIENYCFLYNDSLDILPCIIVSCLEFISENGLKQLFFTLEKSNVDADVFIIFLFSGLKQAIYRNDISYPEVMITAYRTLSSLFPVLSKYSKYFYYISSGFYLIQKGDIKLAEYFCDFALSEKTDDQYLAHLVDFQKAVILRHKTQLNEAINKFSNLYNYFSRNGKWDSAVECILEWGGVLREKTKFINALEVYDKIDVEKLEVSLAIQIKIHRKKGTIYKNIMQQLRKEYLSSTDNNQELLEKIRQYYNNAIAEYESAKKKSYNSFDMIEKMKIISEQAEVCLKFSDIDSAQMYRAELFLSEHDRLIALFPIPDAQIIQLRLKSKFEEMKGNLKEAMIILEDAREIAVNGAKIFRVFEVDYQFGRLVEKHKENLSPVDLQKGLDSLEKAIASSQDKDSQYVKNCIESKNNLKIYIAKK
ncbi:MAG: SIR2 family protein [Treponema sp.]|nr:SIR2 family protein [Treponema sp.]